MYHQELIDSAKSHLIGNYKALESLEHRSGINVESGTTETFQAFEAAVAEWDSKLGLPAQPSKLIICRVTVRAYYDIIQRLCRKKWVHCRCPRYRPESGTLD